MTYFAETRADNGMVRELHVFRLAAERDAWVAAEVPEADETNGWEVGPREAAYSYDAQLEFRRGEFPWVVLHSGVRPSGIKTRMGISTAPVWVDLDDYTEQRNTDTGVDWSRDVSFVRDDWSAF